MRTKRIALVIGAAALSGLSFWAGLSTARESAPKVEILQSTSKTILGQPISYPTEKPAKVTAALITMQPGQTTGWHLHEVPLFGYLLEGEITVDYGEHGKRVYKKGDSLVEAIRTPHDGTSTGSVPARLVAVFMGAKGVKNTVKLPAPK
ncbi:MAG: cupin domain-containing protein [Alphaproteobacteria bacterium]|nr:cupin domain-containing protein [Alphaproteobacteria bacterium]